MRQTDDLPVEKEAHDKTRGIPRFADSFHARFAALRYVLGIALLSGLILSSNLWFPTSRSFPRVPLVNALPQAFVPTVEYLLGGLLCVALAASLLAARRRTYLVAVIILLVLLVATDQMRLQPWVYQYLLLLVVVALHPRQSPDEAAAGLTLSLLQLIVAMLYFWSGVQKLNYSFGHEVLPQLLDPLRNYLTLTQMQLTVLGTGIAAVEIFTGCGLLLKRTRKLCLWLALAMHGIVLALLIGEGRNSVVWAWNAALMLMVLVLFRRSETFIRQTFANWRAHERAGQFAFVLSIVCAVLPSLSFWGWWDVYLSGALYSGRTAVAVVRVDARVYEKLPETAKRQVFTTKGGEQMLPLFEWAMADLNVPPYPEARLYKQVAREICKSADDQSQVELIIRGRPGLLDGKYEVSRMSCSQLDE
jgi:hypothetical protein